jgi:hypothetical protein
MSMNRRNLETLLLTLESTPALVAQAAAQLDASQVRRAPDNGGFSLIEHVWHLADLESEGYEVRIRRILSEDEPPLADFKGERVARERCYRDRDLAEGLAVFAAARNRNVNRLRGIRNSDWKRRGAQEGFGSIALEDVPRMMAEHDRCHTAEIALLLAHLQKGMPFPERTVSAVA